MTIFEQDFETMLRKYGAALEDKKRFTAFVKDLFPDQARNVNLLLIAYNMGIAQDIQNTSRINHAFAFRYVKRLMDEFGMSRVHADWIVSVWCVCYGNKVLGKACEITLQKQGSGPAIQDKKSFSGKSYGDLFTYQKSQQGMGLAVTGFSGSKNTTIIFQNKSGNTPVIEIAEHSFRGSSMEEAILTEGIGYIGKGAFADCSGLHQVVFPESMKEIGDSAFEHCSSLKSLTLPVHLERIGANALRGTGLRKMGIPGSVYWIGEGVLADCKELEQMEIPENLDVIPDRMLEGCSRLKKIKLHEHLTSIGERAFFGCSSLDLLTIPDSVTRIGQDAFTNTDSQFIIQCSFGSYAEEYARKNRIKYQLV